MSVANIIAMFSERYCVSCYSRNVEVTFDSSCRPDPIFHLIIMNCSTATALNLFISLMLLLHYAPNQSSLGRHAPLLDAFPGCSHSDVSKCTFFSFHPANSLKPSSRVPVALKQRLFFFNPMVYKYNIKKNSSYSSHSHDNLPT